MEIWNTEGHPKLYDVTVRSTKPQRIIISVEDCCKPNSYYTRQETEVGVGEDVFELSLPLTPKTAFFDIKPVSGSLWSGIIGDPSLSYTIMEKPFTPKWNCTEINQNEHLKAFLRFAIYLSQNKGILYAGDDDRANYRSPDGLFQVKYVKEIFDDVPYFISNSGQKIQNPQYGQPSPTSFRVEINSKKMELAQKYALIYSVAQCMVLFTHEYAHGFLNADPDNEFEADENSIRICRCLGFSKFELADAYAQVFLRYSSDENVERMNRIIALLKKMK